MPIDVSQAGPENGSKKRKLADIPGQKRNLVEVTTVFQGDATAGTVEKLLDVAQFVGSAMTLNYLLKIIDIINYEGLFETSSGASLEALIIPVLMLVSNGVEYLINNKNKTSSIFEKLEAPMLLPTISMSIFAGLKGVNILQQSVSEIPKQLLKGNLNAMPEELQVVAALTMFLYFINNLTQALSVMGFAVEWLGGAVQSVSELIDGLQDKVESIANKNPIKNALTGLAFTGSVLVANQALDNAFFNSELVKSLFENEALKSIIFLSVPSLIALVSPQFLVGVLAGIFDFLALVTKTAGQTEANLAKAVQEHTK